MSTTSYKKKDWVTKVVYYKYTRKGKAIFRTHINYAKTDEEAERYCRESVLMAREPSFFILGVKTIYR